MFKKSDHQFKTITNSDNVPLYVIKNSFNHTGYVRCVFIDDNYIYSGSNHGTVIIHEIKKNFKPVISLIAHTCPILKIKGNDKYLVALSMEKVTIWDKNNNFKLIKILSFSNWTRSVAIDSKYLYVGSGFVNKGRIRIWDLINNFKLIDTVETNEVLALHSDDKFLYSAGEPDRKIVIRDISQNFIIVKTLSGTITDFQTVEMNELEMDYCHHLFSDNTYLFYCTMDNRIQVYDKTSDFDKIIRLQYCTEDGYSDGNYLYSSGKIWDIVRDFKDTQKYTLEEETIVNTHCNKEYLVASVTKLISRTPVTHYYGLQIYDKQNGFNIIKKLQIGSAFCNDIICDQNYIYAIYPNYKIFIYEQNSFFQLKTKLDLAKMHPNPNKGFPRPVIVIFSDNRFLFTSLGRNIYIWNINENFKLELSFEIHPYSRDDHNFSSIYSDMHYLYIGYGDLKKGFISIYDIKNGFKLIKVLSDHPSTISCLFSNKKYLFSSSTNSRFGETNIWDIKKNFQCFKSLKHENDLPKTPDELDTFLGDLKNPNAKITYADDRVFPEFFIPLFLNKRKAVKSIFATSELLFTGTESGIINIWDIISDFSLKQTLSGHRSTINSLFFSGEFLISGSSDQTIIWKKNQQGKFLRYLSDQGVKSSEFEFLKNSSTSYTLKITEKQTFIEKNWYSWMLRGGIILARLSPSNFPLNIKPEEYFRYGYCIEDECNEGVAYRILNEIPNEN